MVHRYDTCLFFGRGLLLLKFALHPKNLSKGQAGDYRAAYEGCVCMSRREQKKHNRSYVNGFRYVYQMALRCLPSACFSFSQHGVSPWGSARAPTGIIDIHQRTHVDAKSSWSYGPRISSLNLSRFHWQSHFWACFPSRRSGACVQLHGHTADSAWLCR